MEIREATAADSGSIIALQKQIYRVDNASPDAEKALSGQLKDDTCKVLVVEDNSKIVATATIYLIQVAIRNKPYALLEGLVVDENFRGKGVGTKFFEEIISICKYLKCYKIIFTSGQDREDAHKFYEKLGFKKWGLEFRMDL